jgi:enoyl-CoA hydratase/carnithine racemase
VVESAHDDSVFLIYAPKPCHDYHQSWLEALNEKLYWEDLLAHFHRVHRLLLSLCLSRSKWFFVSSDDCLGSWWDLALACNGRIWANPYAKVGFPEILIDMIPPLASGGFRKYAAYQTLDDARRHSILLAKDAYASGLISLVLQGEGWASAEGLETLYPWILKYTMTSNLRSTTRKELIDEIPDIMAVIEDRGVLQKRRRQIAASHLDVGYAALKERNITARAVAMSLIRAGGAARVLFEDYRAWLSRRITRYKLGVHAKWWTAADELVAIDLAAGIPPHCLIQELLGRNFHLIFMARSEDSLREGLEIILSRFQRGGVPRKDVIESWRGKLDWMIGDRSVTAVTWLACYPSDLIELGVGTEVLVSRYRLSGNYGQADVGWSEVIVDNVSGQMDSPPLKEGVTEVGDILSSGLLRSSKWPYNISLAVTLRFFLLNEMQKLAQTGDWPDIVEQCKLLQTAGWGFASDMPRWDGLLRNFGDHKSLRDALINLGSELSYQLRRTSIAELRSLSPITGHVTRFDVSAARLSRHFEALAVELCERLIELQAVDSRAMADLFVTLAWGYPKSAPLPSELGSRKGSGRINYWLSSEVVARSESPGEP